MQDAPPERCVSTGSRGRDIRTRPSLVIILKAGLRLEEQVEGGAVEAS